MLEFKIDATRVGGVGELREKKIPGSYSFAAYEGRVMGVNFMCPCGCGMDSYMPVTVDEKDEVLKPCWLWNGDREKPTLRPSVFQSGLPCKWHGYLIKGIWRTSPDYDAAP